MSAILENKAITPFLTAEWKSVKGYRIHLLITQDDADSYSAVALNLPGAGSCGETEEEAVDNAIEAIHAAVEAYVEAGDPIPWKDTSSETAPPGAKQKWIIVDA